MRCSRGCVDHRAFGHLGDLLLAVLGAVMQLEIPLNGVHHLVARIYVELAAVFPPSGHEYQRVRVLPENVDTLARPAELAGGVREADDWHFQHDRNSCGGALALVCSQIETAVNPGETQLQATVGAMPGNVITVRHDDCW